jgi:protein involved in polysaccharide export with SLBB domain
VWHVCNIDTAVTVAPTHTHRHNSLQSMDLHRTGQMPTARTTAAYEIAMRLRSHLALLITAVAVGTSVAASQSAPPLTRISYAPLSSRADLAARATVLEQSSASAKGTDRERTLRELAVVRGRLTEGDFRVGDRLLVVLTRDSAVADTAAVRDSLMVTVSNLPELSVRGVLRSELNDRLRDHVGKYIRNPQVRASLLTRVSISGGVGRPGFFAVPPDRPLTELIMVAGGPAPGAKLDRIELIRGRTTYLRGRNAKRAVKEGRTLDELGVRSGDEVRVPVQQGFNWGAITQVFFAVSSLTFGVFQIIAVTRSSSSN